MKCGGVAKESPETATAADGTHPTGMHSCNYIYKFSMFPGVLSFFDVF